MLRLFVLLFTCSTLLVACQPAGESVTATAETNPAPAAAPTTPSAKSPDPAAARLLERAYAAHGGTRYGEAEYQFVFRDKVFTFRHQEGKYVYSSRYQKDDKAYYDVIENGAFSRTVDGELRELTEKEYNSGFEALNSVIYFATLPYKLRDPAVNLFAAGPATIKGAGYERLKVNFDEAGGGVDHDDNFMYWINQETGRIDYLAYDYKTNGGGVRFRTAYNPRIVAGILFQDYLNYKAPVGTSLSDLPALYEAGKLEELSVIATEKVERLER